MNWFIVPVILLLINAIFGFGFSASLLKLIFGTSLHVPVLAPLLSEPSRSVIFVFTGILLVRSLSPKKA
ncbi:hypothetical protein ACERII_19365 [Evansella sp. AB-rgal1]|uniref:hypothetical protein n=1 Tax=Evansella sp. AB-rgal1 TaxID=3242696 RepID=UPI00359E89BB